MTSKTDYDVVIIGGGLSGLSLSCLLGKIEGLRVACLDRDAPQSQLAQDERTTAISYGSAQILKRAGVWDAIEAKGCPIEDIEILDGDSPLLLQFLSREVEDKPFGWIVANRDIRVALMTAMEQMKNVTHIAPQAAKAFAVEEACARITLADGREITAALVVGADGRQSSVRDFMDVPVRGRDYHQRAVVCFVLHENPHKNSAVEHFWPAGPFAILPMNTREDGRHCSSLVFTEHGPKSKTLMKLSDEAFLEEVKKRFPARYGAIEILENKRLCYPLTLSHAAEYIAPRMVLVADAAHGIHPIAGQGLNLGFRDIGELAMLIRDAQEKGRDIASHALLATYQRRRRPDNMAMIAVTDALVRLFSNDIMPVRLLRRAGLRAVSRLAPVKRFFMVRAMGE